MQALTRTVVVLAWFVVLPERQHRPQIAPELCDDLIQTRCYSPLALRFAFGNREDFDDEDYRNIELTSPAACTDTAAV